MSVKSKVSFFFEVIGVLIKNPKTPDLEEDIDYEHPDIDSRMADVVNWHGTPSCDHYDHPTDDSYESDAGEDGQYHSVGNIDATGLSYASCGIETYDAGLGDPHYEDLNLISLAGESDVSLSEGLEDGTEDDSEDGSEDTQGGRMGCGCRSGCHDDDGADTPEDLEPQHDNFYDGQSRIW